MIADCRAGKRQGWRHFVTHFAPACLVLLKHYNPAADDDDLKPFLLAMRDDPASPVHTAAPMTEREFAVHVRNFLVGNLIQPPEPDEPFPLDVVAAAVADFTPTQKQALWLSLLEYRVDQIANLLRASPESVDEVLGRADEAFRAASFSLEELRNSATDFRLAVAASLPDEPVPVKRYLDAIDGRQSWSERHDLDARLAASWYEVDWFCRVRETDAALRDAAPPTDAEVAEWLLVLGFEPERPPFWKRWFSR